MSIKLSNPGMKVTLHEQWRYNNELSTLLAWYYIQRLNTWFSLVYISNIQIAIDKGKELHSEILQTQNEDLEKE